MENADIEIHHVDRSVDVIGQFGETSPNSADSEARVLVDAGEVVGARIPEQPLFGRIAKRSVDIIGALAIGILALPVIVVLVVAIRLSGSGVVFGHKRVGKDREPFTCYKFRSMIPDAERVLQDMLRSDPEIQKEWLENHKLEDDPRVTRLGDFLRRSSVDELPQLWNVLKGEMSLVGPRPIVEDELQRYGNKAKTYLSVRPGMTGLWQIMGRSSVSYARRVALDAWYVRKQNILLDTWILFRTAIVVFKRIGAH